MSPTRPKTLDDLIDDAGLSVRELVRKTKLNERNLLELRRGRTKRPHTETVRVLAAALGVEIREVRDAVEAGHD